MNGSIESFNGWFGSKFWDKDIFADLEDMRTMSLHFVDQYNDLSTWKKRDKGLEHIKPVRMLKNAAEIDLDKLPLTEGQVHFIRQVDTEGQINVLNEDFKVGKEFISEYVWSTVCTGKQKMEAYYRAQDQNVAMLIKEFDYTLSVEVEHIRNDIWKT